jgi:hypothetical protein
MQRGHKSCPASAATIMGPFVADMPPSPGSLQVPDAAALDDPAYNVSSMGPFLCGVVTWTQTLPGVWLVTQRTTEVTVVRLK